MFAFQIESCSLSVQIRQVHLQKEAELSLGADTDQNQITQSQVAQRLTMAQSKINEICRGKRGVTPDMAMRLGKLFGQNPLFWLTLQKNWELSQLDESVYAGIEPFQMAV